MSHADSQLDCGERRGDRGIHIAHNQHHLRLVVNQNRLNALHDIGSLNRVAGRTGLKIDIRHGQSQVRKKVAGEQLVIMLARMHQTVLDAGKFLQLRDNGSDLHKIRSRAHHTEKPDHRETPNTILSEMEDPSWRAAPLPLLGSAVGGRTSVGFIGSRTV